MPKKQRQDPVDERPEDPVDAQPEDPVDEQSNVPVGEAGTGTPPAVADQGAGVVDQNLAEPEYGPGENAAPPPPLSRDPTPPAFEAYLAGLATRTHAFNEGEHQELVAKIAEQGAYVTVCEGILAREREVETAMIQILNRLKCPNVGGVVAKGPA